MHRYSKATAITPHDTNKVTRAFDAIFVSTTAAASTDMVNLAVQFTLGTTVTFRVPAGVIIPVAPQRVMSTGTDATQIHGLEI